MSGVLVRLDSVMHRAEIIFKTVEEIDAEYAVPSAYRYFVGLMHDPTFGKEELT